MDFQRNYYSYFVLEDGTEWMDSHPYEMDVAYEEALRHKAERNPVEVGVKVFEQNCFKIISWKEGRHWYSKGKYLYKIRV